MAFKSFSLKVVWAVLLGVVTFMAALAGILGFFGFTPNETAKVVRLAVTIAAEIDTDALTALVDLAQEIEDRGLLDKWEQALNQDLAQSSAILGEHGP